MSKGRPDKSFRLEGERPFKTYNLGISSSYLFADSRRFEQRQVSLATSPSSLMQQQQLHLRQHQPQSTQLNQHMFNDPSEYLRIRTQFQLGYENSVQNHGHFSYDYDDVTLDSSDNHLTRSDLPESSESPCLHGELDLNISNGASTDSGLQNYIEPSRSSYRAAASGSLRLGDQGAFSMLFEHPMTFFSSGLPRSLDNATATNYSSFNNGNISQALSTSFNSSATHASGTSRHGKAMALSTNTDNVPVKQEFHEGGFVTIEKHNMSINSRDGSYHSLKYNPDLSLSECSMPLAVSFPGTANTLNSYQSDCNDNKSQGEVSKDETYMEKRRKNNESAKRSREARRTKEELVALRVIGLEEENMKLQAEICMLDKELDQLRAQLYQCN